MAGGANPRPSPGHFVNEWSVHDFRSGADVDQPTSRPSVVSAAFGIDESFGIDADDAADVLQGSPEIGVDDQDAAARVAAPEQVVEVLVRQGEGVADDHDDV